MVGEDKNGGVVADPNTSAQILYTLLKNIPIESDWSNFEDCLGKLDFHPTLDLAEKDEENLFHTQYNIEDLISSLKPSLLLAVFDLLKEWIDSIDIFDVKRKYCFESNDLFLTFNYTKVLESVYNINKNNICHIHGPLDDGHCVTGHGNYYRDFSDYDELISFEIKEISDSLIKPVRFLLEKQTNFMDNLRTKKIDEIIFFGFSFGDVDLYYIEHLFKILDTTNVKLYLSEFEDINYREEKVDIIKSLGFRGIYVGPFR